MSGVRVLVGTRKGAFVLTSGGKRNRWDISGPHFGGWEMYHLKGSPADPNRVYASQSSGWFGQVIQRSNDGGKTWETVGNEFVYDGATGTHQWYDGTQHPWQFARVWHLEPSPDDPDVVYAGVEDAALFRSEDGGRTWQELPGLRCHGSGPRWQPGAGGMCLHTILLDPDNPKRIFVATVRRSADPAMIRVVLPPHLRTLARVNGEVKLQIEGPATQRSVLDALEAHYPVLRGTIRGHVTHRRRPFLRFFACEQDLSHELPDALLPDPVAAGDEPFLIVGAMAGG
jgi:hypothetical protein